MSRILQIFPVLWVAACAADERPVPRAEVVVVTSGRQFILAGGDAVFEDPEAILSGTTPLTQWFAIEPPVRCIGACVLDLSQAGTWVALGMHTDLRGGIDTSSDRTRGELRVTEAEVSVSFEYLADGQVVFTYLVPGYPFFRD